jgi:homoserine O-succinyltransferase
MTHVSQILPNDSSRLRRRDVRPLRLGIINLMPEAESYEATLLRPLNSSTLPIEPIWIRLTTHTYPTSDPRHLRTHYRTFEQTLNEGGLDALLVTGAPADRVQFESLRYWNELQNLLRYARQAVPSTLGLSWGGLALARLMGLPKTQYAKKLLGVYPLRRLQADHALLHDSTDVFVAPQSRYAGLADQPLEAAEQRGEVRLLAHSGRTGYSILESADGRLVAHLGHPEYEPAQLVYEYERDRHAGHNDVDPPQHVALARPRSAWGTASTRFFRQWIRLAHERSHRQPAQPKQVA